jgi:hypothetical protein
MEMSGQLHAQAALHPMKVPPLRIGIGGWVGTRAGIDAVVKRKIPASAGNRTLVVNFELRG